MNKTEQGIALLRQLEIDNAIIEQNFHKGRIGGEKYIREKGKNRLDTLTKLQKLFNENSTQE
jgi:hypothetical protein